MYVGKTCDANPTSTYPPCYALDISTELLKGLECVVIAMELQLACGGLCMHIVPELSEGTWLSSLSIMHFFGSSVAKDQLPGH